MNNIFKVLLLILLTALCVILLYTSFKANAEKLIVCPVDAISMKNGIAVIDTLRCIGCDRCVRGIPNPTKLNLFPAIKPAVEDTVNIENPVIEQTEQQTAIQEAETPEVKVKTEQKTEPVLKTESTVNPDTTLVYTVLPDKCIGCRLCVYVCPTGAISVSRRIATIDQSKCINCGACKNGNGTDYAGCPVDAIVSSKKGE